MSLFSVGHTEALLGQPAIPRADARLTDAVVAAVKVMNKYDQTPTSVMDPTVEGATPAQTDPEVDKIELLVRATNSHAIANQDKLGQPTLIKWGLFVNDWTAFRERAATKTQSPVERDAFRGEAVRWSQQIRAATEPPATTSSKSSAWPLWKRLLLLVGVGGVGVIAIRLALKLKEPAYNQPVPE